LSADTWFAMVVLPSPKPEFEGWSCLQEK